jgi:hexokinase
MMFIALAAVMLLAQGAGAEVSGLSEPAALDTRSLSRVAAADASALDTRTFTADWSAPRTLDTRKIIGTLFLLK